MQGALQNCGEAFVITSKKGRDYIRVVLNNQDVYLLFKDTKNEKKYNVFKVLQQSSLMGV